MEDEKKEGVDTQEGFLKTAAETVGATLGKLALRTGLARPPVSTEEGRVSSED
jgi:hypothetical protein